MYKLERAMQRININKDISAVNIKNPIQKIGFFYFHDRDACFYCIYCAFYCCFWKIVLWLGMPTNNFYGNDF